MPIGPLSAALQGALSGASFAPFAFSPIAFAIQGLIEEIQTGAVIGGGGRHAGRERAPRQAHQEARQRPRGNTLTVEHVRAHWELLEARLRAQEARARPEHAARHAPDALPGAATRSPASAAAPGAGLVVEVVGDDWTDDEIEAAALALLMLD